MKPVTGLLTLGVVLVTDAKPSNNVMVRGGRPGAGYTTINPQPAYVSLPVADCTFALWRAASGGVVSGQSPLREARLLDPAWTRFH
jgi:hypothetical protein